MEKYQQIIGKKIKLVFNSDIINSYTIKDLTLTVENMLGRGKLYKGNVEWENKKLGGVPFMLFDEQTLNDLLFKNKALSPDIPDMYFEIETLKN